MNKTSSAIVRALLLGTSCLSVFALSAAKADPTGGTVIAGSATINSNGNSTTINQSTNRALINWNTFSIAAGGSVRFNQPGTTAITVNRVTGAQSSTINGSLLANGQVWLINGNGILFGKGAQVNVGGLIATTSDIADRDFAAGNFSFGGGTGASVVNQGTIRARNGGAIVLSGAGVRNQGLIQADAGTVVLGGAAAFTVDFYGDNLLRYAITAPAGKADDGASGVTNSGTIKANNGGRVVMTARAAADVAGAVINNTGIVAATSARVQNGEVVLDGGDGDVNVAGSIDASGYGAGRSGGFVDVTGRNITVADNANIDVSGDSGGGRVRIGGDAHGAGPLPQAASVHVGRATISADATRRGDGGTLVVWSNGLTDFSGIASAMGGAEGGNGGFVETSGHVLQVGDGAKVTTLAPKGHTGLWLLDPSDIAIVDGGADGVGGSNIDPDTLIAALAGTDIALEAANTITVNSAVDYNSDNRLSLLAQNSITVNASIQNAGAGAIDLIAGWDGVTVDPAHFADAGVFAVGGAFNHSNVFFNTAAVGSHGGTTTVAGWQVSLAAFSNSAYSQIGYRGAEGGGGDIRVNTVSNLRLSTNSGVSNAVAQIGNGDKLGSVASNVTGNITLNVGNNLSLAMNAGGIGQAVWIGNASNGGTIAGDVAITTASFSDDSYVPNGGSAPLLPMLAQDTAYGDVLLDVTGGNLTIASALTYAGAHNLTLETGGSLNVNAAITNTGSGSLTLDGNYITANADGAVAAAAVTLQSDTGIDFYYSGNNIVAGSLDIHAGGGVLLGGDSNAVSNLAFDLSAGQFNFSSSLDLTVGTSSAAGGAGLGSQGAIVIDGHVTAGSFSIVSTGTLSETENGYLESGGTAFFAVNYSAGGSGIQLTNPLNAISGAITAYNWVGDTAYYSNSAVTLAAMTFTAGDVTILSGGNIDVTGNIQLSGSSDVSLIAGWNGIETDPAHFLDGGVYGDNGTITIGNAAVGSAGGATTLAATDIALQGTGNGVRSQIGYRGAGGGDINVVAMGALTLYATAGDASTLSQIGNGDRLGSVSGAVSGNISIAVGTSVAGVLTLQRDNTGGTIWIGNSSTGGGTGDLKVVAYSEQDINSNTPILPMLAADTEYGDVFYGIYGTGANTAISIDAGSPITYNSSHTLSLLGDGVVFHRSLLNSGSGAINVVAGWDGIETRLDHLTDTGVYGNNGANIYIESAGNAVSVGSAGGTTTLAASSVTVRGISGGVAQLGYNGVGGGDIVVNAVGGMAFENDGDVAIIGNGGIGFAGAVTGNITLKAGGTFSIDNSSGAIYLGNQSTGTVSGDLSVVTGFLSETNNFLEGAASQVLATGDVTLGVLFDDVAFGGISANSSHTLNLLGAYNVDIIGAVANSGSGAVNVVAGWDGTTLDPAQFTTSGVYGANNGQLSLGADVGSATGLTTLAAHDITQTAAITTATLDAYAAGDVNLATSSDDDSDMRNGIATASFHAGGVVFLSNDLADLTLKDVSAGGGISISTNLNAGTHSITVDGTLSAGVDCESVACISLKAGGDLSETADGVLSASGLYASSAAGSVTLESAANAIDGEVRLHANNGSVSFVDDSGFTLKYSNAIGDFSIQSLSGGITLDDELDVAGATTIAADGDISDTADAIISIGDLAVTSTSGGAFLDTGDNRVTGTVTFDVATDVSFLNGPSVTLGASAAGGTLNVLTGGGISVTGAVSAATISLTSLDTGDIDITAALTADGGIQLQTGTGSITQTSAGTLTASTLLAYAFDGNIGLDGAANAISDTVNLLTQDGDASFTNSVGFTIQDTTVAGQLTLTATTGDITLADGVSFGVSADGITVDAQDGGITITGAVDSCGCGAVSLTASGDIKEVDDEDNDLYGTLSTGGDLNVTSYNGRIALLGYNDIQGTASFQSAGDALFYNYGGVDIGASVVGGTLFVNAGGDVTQSGAITAANLAVEASGCGCDPASIVLDAAANAISGSVAFQADGDVTFKNANGFTLSGVTIDDLDETIGTSIGGALTATAVTGGITIDGAVGTGSASASSLTAKGDVSETANGTLTGGAFSVTSTTGNIALGGDNELSGTVALDAFGYATFNNTIGVALGASSAGGALTVSAAGDVTQSGALTAASLDVSTTGGAITLTDAGNSFATLTVGTTGGDDASIADSTAVAVAGATVGGTFTLTAADAITQSGAITANAFDVSATTGAITLADSGNSFGTLTVGTTGGFGATLNDSSAVDVAGATVGGTFTLSADGAIGQSGAITAAAFVVSTTSGAITLTHTGNQFSTLTVATQDADDATITETAALMIAGATVGGALTLDIGGSVQQNAAITAGSLFVTATSFALLDNVANNVSGSVGFDTGGAASFVDSVGFTLQASDIGAGLAATALSGGITVAGYVQFDAGSSGDLTAADDIVEGEFGSLVGGTLTVTSNGGGIGLAGPGNSLSGTVTLSAAGDAMFFNSQALDLGTASVGGLLYVGAAGAVTQSGAISAGSLAVSAACGIACTPVDVTLTNAANAIAGNVAFGVDGNVVFVDSVGFSLGLLDLGVNTDHTYIGGSLTATALTGGITVNEGVQTGLLGAGGATLTAAGDVVETADGYITGFGLDVTSNGGRIALLGANDVFGAVSLHAAGDALFANGMGVTLGASSAGGTLYIGAVGDVTQTGAISAANLAVDAVASICGCEAGDVTLDNAANAISGKVAIQADGDVIFKNAGAIKFADVDIDDLEETLSTAIGGALTATAVTGGITIDGAVGSGAASSLTAVSDIAETANGYLTGGGFTVTSTAGKIALDNASNDVTGILSLNAQGNASFATGAKVSLGAGSVAGNLTVLAQGDILVAGSIQNSGSGAITLVAGWDGTTRDAAHFLDAGVYGNGGDVEFGGGLGDAALGSAAGLTTIAARDVTLFGTGGYQQIGYHGAGGGDIVIRATGNLVLNASGGFDALIGNGSRGGDVTGNVGGDIDIRVDFGNTQLSDGPGARAWIGNVTGGPGKARGDIRFVTDFGALPTDMIAADLGTSADTGGDFFFGYTDPNDGYVSFGGLTYNSPHNFTIAAPADLRIVGSIQNAGTGAVTLVAGWDEMTFGPAAALRAANAFGLHGAVLTVAGGNVAAGSAGGLTSVLTKDLVLTTNTGYAQIGYHGAGGGNIAVVALGDLTMSGGALPAKYAMIGNGALYGGVAGNITGNIDIRVGGTTALYTSPGGGPAWIGNVAAGGYSATGNLVLVTAGFGGTASASEIIAADLAVGDVTIGITDSGAEIAIDEAILYNSSHTLNLLATGDLGIAASIQNGGTGAINVVAGWNGTTLDPAQFFQPGVYGNNGGTLMIGGVGAAGDVAVGSFGGATNLGAGAIMVVGINGYAQAGYHGAGGGALGLHALGALTLNGNAPGHWAQIGNGLVFGSNDAGSTVGISAASIQGNANAAVTGGGLTLIATGGNIGALGAALRIASASLEVTTTGGKVFLTSPDDGVTFAGSGVNLAGGAFSLAAGGAILQTAAIHTGQIALTTTAGDIVLTDAGNSFGALTVATPGNASFKHASLLTIASADVDGTLTLAAGTGVNQSGALVAGGLVVSTAAGGIVLTNSGNAFGTLDVAGPGDASIVDSTGVVLASANLGGAFTLAAGGAIAQNGALHVGALNVSTTAGGIVLTDAGNTFGALTVSTMGSDDATLTDAALLTVASADVGGTLTLAAGTGVEQSGAIVAGGLVVSTSAGNIVLTHAGNAFATLGLTGPGNASIVDSTGVAILGADLGGAFTLVAGGAILQTGALHTGAFAVSTASGGIVLTDAGNTFGPLTVSTTGGNGAAFAHAGLLTVASAQVGGTLTLAAGTGVNQTGAILAAGLVVSSTAGNIVLTNTGNSFATLGLTGAGDASIVDVIGVSLSGVDLAGALTLAAGGAIAQSGALHTGALNVSAASGGIVLANAGNTFGALTAATTGAAAFTDAGLLTVASATIGGTLTLAAGTGIEQTGAIVAPGLIVSTAAGNILLANAGNSFAALTVTGAGDAAIVDSTAVSLASADLGGTLTLAAGGAIGQTGAIHAGGLAVSTTAGSIVLTNAGNSFATLGVSGPGHASIVDSTGVSVVSADLTGALTLIAAGAISQTGAIHTSGLGVSTTAGDIVLTHAGNSFATLSVSGPGDASFADSTALSLFNADLGGKLTLAAGGAISQTGALHAAALAISTTAGGIVLTHAGNSFAALGISGPGDASIVDSTGVSLTGVDLAGNLTLAAGGAIGQTGALHAAGLVVSTSNGGIVLTNTGNAFGTLDVTGPGDASIVDSTALAVAKADLGGMLTLAAGGAISQTGAIHAAALAVSTTAGGIVLANGGNSFAALGVSGAGSADIVDSTAVSLTGVDLAGSLTLAAGGAISQSGALHTGALAVSTTGGGIALTNAGNTFGALTASTAGAAAFTDAGLLTVASATIGGALTLAAGTGVEQTGTIVAPSLIVSTTAGNIVLANAGNSFATLGVSGPGDASIVDSTGVSLSGVDLGGSFTLAAGGAIAQTGALQAAGVIVSTAAGDIVLTHSGNSFATLDVTGPGGASIVDATGVSLAGADLGGALTLVAGGAIGQTGALHTGALNVSATAGAIVLTNAGNTFGALTASTTTDAAFTDAALLTVASTDIGGTLTLAAGTGVEQTGALVAGGLVVSTATGSIVLTDAGNAFGTLDATAPGDVSIADATALSVAKADVGGTFALAAGGAISQTGTILAATFMVSTTGGDIVLTDAGNSFATLGISGPGNASIVDSTAVSLSGADLGGALTLAAGGAISQSGALHTGALNVSATGGGIVLTNAGNTFGALTAATAGDAAFTDAALLTVANAGIGGTLTLAAGTGIEQSGAIVAPSLVVSTAAGDIALTNAGNSFATLNATGPGNASIVDATGVTVTGIDLGGAFTLAAGGAISQTGALHTGALNVSATSGGITLTNAGNTFGALTAATAGDAAFTDAGLLTVANAGIGGTLTLHAATGVDQTGAIVAPSLVVFTAAGDIVLAAAGNSFALLDVTAPGDATISDSTGITLTNVALGGKLTLLAGGAVGQSGAIAAHGLAVQTTAGAIVLSSLSNAVTGTAQFATPGALTFYNTQASTIGATNAGGDVALLSKGNVVFVGSLQSVGGNIAVVAGWDGATVNPAAFGNDGVYGNNSGPMTGNIVIGGSGAAGAVAVGAKNGGTSLYADNVAVVGLNGTAQLGYHGSGGGAILIRARHDMVVGANAFTAMAGNGALTDDVQGGVGGDIDVRLGGNAVFNGTADAKAWFGNVAHGGAQSGNVLFVANDVLGTQDSFAAFVVGALAGGDVTIGFTGAGDQGPDTQVVYDSSHTLNVMTAGNLVIAGAIQNAGSGAINAVAGWDGHTLDAAAFGTAGVYGNNGKGIVIGGADAAGNAALGSAGGRTSVYGASLALNAAHGYAQLGFNGHGAGAIAVKVTGAVTLSGGAADNQFAQIGHGGRGTSGDNSGDITISAGGDLALNGGGGTEAYAQIGHGGAESNSGANGYSNVAAITISAANVRLNAGPGGAAYAMIGNGGYKAGLNLAGGTAINGGNITVLSAHTVILQANGPDAYAQIGNGGALSNLNPTAAAGGSDFGDIVVTAPNGPEGAVKITAGSGANAYAQIGNGGYGINSGPTTTVANFTVSGNITVTDLDLTGGTGGPNAYALIGNGDLSHHSIANVSGNIVIQAGGQITYTTGTSPHSPATIGNFTGVGTVLGTLVGANPPSELSSDPTVLGLSASGTADSAAQNTGRTTIQTQVIDDPNGSSAVTRENANSRPLASLEGEDGTLRDADSATVVIADSLNGAQRTSSTTILFGILKTMGSRGAAAHGVPPADQDFSSWGNEALWQ